MVYNFKQIALQNTLTTSSSIYDYAEARLFHYIQKRSSFSKLLKEFPFRRRTFCKAIRKCCSSRQVRELIKARDRTHCNCKICAAKPLLFLALRQGWTPIVKLLLRSSPKAFEATEDGLSALYYVATPAATPLARTLKSVYFRRAVNLISKQKPYSNEHKTFTETPSSSSSSSSSSLFDNIDKCPLIAAAANGNEHHMNILLEYGHYRSNMIVTAQTLLCAVQRFRSDDNGSLEDCLQTFFDELGPFHYETIRLLCSVIVEHRIHMNVQSHHLTKIILKSAAENFSAITNSKFRLLKEIIAYQRLRSFEDAYITIKFLRDFLAYCLSEYGEYGKAKKSRNVDSSNECSNEICFGNQSRNQNVIINNHESVRMNENVDLKNDCERIVNNQRNVFANRNEHKQNNQILDKNSLENSCNDNDQLRNVFEKNLNNQRNVLLNTKLNTELNTKLSNEQYKYNYRITYENIFQTNNSYETCNEEIISSSSTFNHRKHVANVCRNTKLTSKCRRYLLKAMNASLHANQLGHVSYQRLKEVAKDIVAIDDSVVHCLFEIYLRCGGFQVALMEMFIDVGMKLYALNEHGLMAVEVLNSLKNKQLRKLVSCRDCFSRNDKTRVKSLQCTAAIAANDSSYLPHLIRNIIAQHMYKKKRKRRILSGSPR